jgi:hypothetical protein
MHCHRNRESSSSAQHSCCTAFNLQRFRRAKPT